MGSPTFDRQVFVKRTQSQQPPPRSPLPGAFALLLVAALAAFATYRYMKAGGGVTSNSADKVQIKQLQQKLKVMQARIKELERHRALRTSHVANDAKPEKKKPEAAKPSHTLLADPAAQPAGRIVAGSHRPADPEATSHVSKTPASTSKQPEPKSKTLLASAQSPPSKELTTLQNNLAANNDQWQATVDRLGNVVGQLDSQGNAIQKNQKNVSYLMEMAHRANVSFTLRKGRKFHRVGPVSMELAGTSVRNQHYNIRLIVNDRPVELKDRALNEVVQFYTPRSKYPLELIVSQIGRNQVSGTLVVPPDLSKEMNNPQLQEK